MESKFLCSKNLWDQSGVRILTFSNLSDQSGLLFFFIFNFNGAEFAFFLCRGLIGEERTRIILDFRPNPTDPIVRTNSSFNIKRVHAVFIYTCLV